MRGTAPRTLAIIPKRSRPEARALAVQVAEWLRARGCRVLCEPDTHVDGAEPVASGEIASRADMLVVLGGDGTLLHAARLCERREVALLGVNMGTLGFLTEVPRSELWTYLARVLAGDFTLDRRSKLRVRLVRGEKELLDAEVLNDVVVTKNALSRLAAIEARVEGRRLTTFHADGVIVATPTGSSAYSLAAGGPLVHPLVQATLVVPICPHTLSERPIVVPDDRAVELELASESEMWVTLDGQSGQALCAGDRVVAERAPTGLLLVRGPQAYFDTLRARLRWGER